MSDQEQRERSDSSSSGGRPRSGSFDAKQIAAKTNKTFNRLSQKLAARVDRDFRTRELRESAFGPLDSPWSSFGLGQVWTVNSETVGGFFSRDETLPKALLFSRCPMASPLFAQAASVFANRLVFGEVSISQMELISEFSVLPEETPKILVLTGRNSAPVSLCGGPATSFAELCFFLAGHCASPSTAGDIYNSGTVAKVGQDNMRAFLGPEGGVPRIVFFTNTDLHCTVQNELAWLYRGVYAFGMVNQTEISVMETFGVEPKDLPRLLVLSCPSRRAKAEPVAYEGPLDLLPMALFMAAPHAMAEELEAALAGPQGALLMASGETKAPKRYGVLGRKLAQRLSRGPMAAWRDRSKKTRETREADAMVRWTDDIIPNFHELRDEPWVGKLWRRGLPSKVRGQVWHLALTGEPLGADDSVYFSTLNRAMQLRRLWTERREALRSARRVASGSTPRTPVDEDAEATKSPLEWDALNAQQMAETERYGKDHEQIGMDLQRTFPTLGFFSLGGELSEPLRDVLETYALARLDVGYVQGMSHIAAILLLFLEPPEAFRCMLALLDKHHFRDFFRMDLCQIQRHLGTFDTLFATTLPDLHAHVSALHIESQMFLIEWWMTVFTSALPLDLAVRAFDWFVLDGEPALFRTALGILTTLEPTLLAAEHDNCLVKLTHLAECTLEERAVFKAMKRITVPSEAIWGLLAAQEAVPIVLPMSPERNGAHAETEDGTPEDATDVEGLQLSTEEAADSAMATLEAIDAAVDADCENRSRRLST